MKPLCPTCRKELASDARSDPFPFCSRRCKLVDLYHWLNEEYRFSEPAAAELEQGVDEEGGYEGNGGQA